jgi:hypothetical protein
MGKKITHICDGCGALHEGEDMPAMWRSVHVNVSRVIDDGPHTRLAGGCFDLCEICADELVRKIDPTTWPRVIAERSK